jgi:hypothetical protein
MFEWIKKGRWEKHNGPKEASENAINSAENA